MLNISWHLWICSQLLWKTIMSCLSLINSKWLCKWCCKFSWLCTILCTPHDVMIWKRFLNYWPFVRESINFDFNINVCLLARTSCWTIIWLASDFKCHATHVSLSIPVQNYPIQGKTTWLLIYGWNFEKHFHEMLQWRHNKHDGASNHQRIDCLPNHLFRRRSKKTLKLRVTDLRERN